MHIGDRIKTRRKELNLSLRQLAEKAGYANHSTIARIESGEVDLPQSKVVLFADVLQTTTSYLMGWEETDSALSSDQHSITIRGRDGSVIEKDLTDDQLELIARMVEQFDKK